MGDGEELARLVGVPRCHLLGRGSGRRHGISHVARHKALLDGEFERLGDMDVAQAQRPCPASRRHFVVIEALQHARYELLQAHGAKRRENVQANRVLVPGIGIGADVGAMGPEPERHQIPQRLCRALHHGALVNLGEPAGQARLGFPLGHERLLPLAPLARNGVVTQIDHDIPPGSTTGELALLDTALCRGHSSLSAGSVAGCCC
jgi:hypothetical protein